MRSLSFPAVTVGERIGRTSKPAFLNSSEADFTLWFPEITMHCIAESLSKRWCLNVIFETSALKKLIFFFSLSISDFPVFCKCSYAAITVATE